MFILRATIWGIGMLVLGIESSCDDTAAAVVEDGRRVLSSVVHSQTDLHQRFGGVVPEIASRDHLRRVLPVVRRALDDAELTLKEIDALAVTEGPGLIGSLLVGLQTAKALAMARGLPITFVDHVQAHTSAAFLGDGPEPPFPHVALAVSGGHSSVFLVRSHFDRELIGYTMDDAAGEAFDKVAKLLGMPQPGGVSIDRLAPSGDREAIRFPRPRVSGKPHLFSFSGLKTAVRNHVIKLGHPPSEAELADIAASFLEAVCDVLVARTLSLARTHDARSVVVAGGVAASPRLRALFQARCERERVDLFLTPRAYCTDNAAMIAGQGFRQLEAFGPAEDPLSRDAYSNAQTKGPKLAVS